MKKKEVKKKSDPLIPHARLLRLFQIIAVLKTGHWTVANLAERFDTSERTIYRYIHLLEEVDFLIEKDFSNRYFIITSDDDDNQPVFSIEETALIRKLIETAAYDNPVKSSLLKKLALNSEMDSIPRLFVKARLSRIVDDLAQAIKGKKQVLLKSYHSANSGEIRDRLIEPIHFGDNYQSVIALDTQDHVCKQFKLDRIGEVISMKTTFQHEDLHQKQNTDIFGFTGDGHTNVTLKLTLRSYLLLREEFPLSLPYTEKKEDHYQFHGPVASFEGVGRFVLGLIDEIQIAGPAEFKQFLQAKIHDVKL